MDAEVSLRRPDQRRAKSVIAASRERRVMVCKTNEINFLGGPGKGVLLIKLDKSDRLLGVIHSRSMIATRSR